MSEINLPPFYIGQEVVCIKKFRIDDPNIKYPIKKSKYRVRTIEMCETYGLWVIRVCEIKNPILGYREGNLEARFATSWFKAIQENFQSISYEQVMEEESKLISSN